MKASLETSRKAAMSRFSTGGRQSRLALRCNYVVNSVVGDIGSCWIQDLIASLTAAGA